MSSSVAILGADINGLVAALRLARSGRAVELFEEREEAGGAAGELRLDGNYRVPGLVSDTSTLRPWLLSSLGVAPQEVECAGGGGLLRAGVEKVMVRQGSEVRGLSKAAQEGYAEWRSFLGKARELLLPILEAPLPKLQPDGIGDYRNWLRLGLRLRSRHSGGGELLRALPMSATDLIREFSDDPTLVQFLAVRGLQGSFVGPGEPGTAANLLIRESLSGHRVQGGSARIVRLLSEKCRQAGVCFHLGRSLQSIQVRRESVQSLTFQDGTETECRALLCAISPRRVFLELIAPEELRVEWERDLTNLRCRGVTAYLLLGVNEVPEFCRHEGTFYSEVFLGGESVDYVSRAFDSVKYAEFSREPFLQIDVPSLRDPSLAGEGSHTIVAKIYTAPHDPEAGWDDSSRGELKSVALEKMEQHAPGLGRSIEVERLVTPRDLAMEFGLPGGHLEGGEHALDQMGWLRPALWCSHYRTPIQGLYLIGSSCHPGGFFTGLPGWLGADAYLSDEGG